MFIELTVKSMQMKMKVTFNTDTISFIQRLNADQCNIFVLGQEHGFGIDMPITELTAKLNEALRPK